MEASLLEAIGTWRVGAAKTGIATSTAATGIGRGVLPAPSRAARLPPGSVTASPARSSLEAAEGLYSQLEEEVHDLVSKSNSCLERLEFLRKTRELEAEFGELGRWLDGEAAARLEEMGAQEWSPDGCEKPCEQFKEFLTQATARYNHGLALCQEAAEVQDSAFPEADSFQVAAALFRTKLMSFHAAVERRRAELEMLEELCRFSSKITWLNLDCKCCLACVKRGESQTGNLEVLQCLESSFQKLSVDFSLKKLQEMEAHVHAMRSSSGLGAGTAAWQRYQEARQVLEEMLAELQQAWAAGADGHGKGDAFGSSHAGPAGVYCCGPAPVKAIKEGDLTMKYDIPFIFAEVNADVVYWITTRDGSQKKTTHSSIVGKNISTKGVGRDSREDITHNYKYPEGSEKEREVFAKAEHEKSYLSEEDEGLHLKIKLSEGANNGCDFDVFAVINNNTDTERVCRLMICTLQGLEN
nr:PREDICTED: protein-glutamine gamma-glutamyltransferase 2 [Struthio camelus australis]